MGLLEKCIISLEAEARRLENQAVLSAAAGATQESHKVSDAPSVVDDAERQPIPIETFATAGVDAGGASVAANREINRQEEAEFEKLRRKKSEQVHVTDYVDRRKSGRSTDRRQSRRLTEGYNTLTSTNLRKNFGAKEIVRGVGFSMRGGDVAGLLGPNGAGKTTIFYMIVGFYKPTTGDIKLNGVSIINGPMYRRARMGIAYLPQEASIFRKLTVQQNIWAILESRTDINKKQKKEKLDELITEFGIERIRKQPGYTLSGGERRRTEIARALAIDPKFLLLDEPFAGIDPMAVSEIKQIIKRLAQNGIGILITDHNVRDTLEITSDAFIINHGSIVARGDRDHILENKVVRDVYLGSDFKM
jgi:lipopolysaccharide export system ATP-binding protein